jgi:hydroxypyruvate reductase
MYNLREDAVSIFKAGVRAVDPRQLIRNNLRLVGNKLSVSGQEYDLGNFNEIIVVGGGKAGAAMAAGIEEVLQDKITDGLVITSYGNSIPVEFINVIEACHPIPDKKGVDGTKELLEILQRADEKTLIVCLISGGGSALLTLPVAGVSLEQIRILTDNLIKSGAAISEINSVRKHLSCVKGGYLAKMAYPATVLTLIISDVVFDPPDVIASGPTVPDLSTYKDALNVLKKHDLIDKTPQTIINHFMRGIHGDIPETPKDGDRVFTKVRNIIIGNNRIALNGAESKARELGYKPNMISNTIEGETKETAKFHTNYIKNLITDKNSKLEFPICLLSGGETTVTVRGTGKGGRNQEFALACAIELKGMDGICVLSCGTDGIDGPTDAAGAISDGETCNRGRLLGYEAQVFLDNNDSYTFFKSLGDLIIIGPTHTNVMDLRIILLNERCLKN